MNDSSTSTRVQCPYCGETIEILLESDLEGELIQDCEVCCNPWQVRIDRGEEPVRVEVRRLDD